MAQGSFERAASQSSWAASSGLPWVIRASLKRSSNCERYFDLPAGLPLTPGPQRCGLPALNCVSGLPDRPGFNFVSFSKWTSTDVETSRHNRRRDMSKEGNNLFDAQAVGPVNL